MKWLRIARAAVPLIEAAVRGARSIAEARRALINAIEHGSFDRALQIAGATKHLIDDYVEKG
jgi:hypothetical protein